MKRLPLVLSFAAVLGLTATSGHTQTINFDQATDFDLFNNLTTSNADGDLYSSTATGGTNGSGGVKVDGNAAVAHYTASTFDLTAVGSSFTLSLDSFFNDNVATGTGPVNRIGFTGTDSTGFGGTGVYLFGGLNRISANTGQLQIGNNTGSSFAGTSSLTDFTLVDDVFYRLTVSFTNSGSNQYAISASLFNIGATGTTPVGAPVATLGSTVTNAPFAADTTTYASFKSDQLSGGQVLDNFSVVPEPSTFAMLLGGAGILAFLSRRR